MSEEWIEQRECKGADPDIFFVNSDGGDSKAKKVEALKYCDVCSVKEECLNYAMDKNIYVGIYGGMTNKERRALKSIRRKAA